MVPGDIFDCAKEYPELVWRFKMLNALLRLKQGRLLGSKPILPKACEVFKAPVSAMSIAAMKDPKFHHHIRAQKLDDSRVAKWALRRGAALARISKE